MNQRTFSGGQVIVNPNSISQFSEINQRATVDHDLQEFNDGLVQVGVNFNAPQPDLDLLQELIDAEIPKNANPTETESLLTKFFENPENIQSLQTFVETEMNQITIVEPENPIQDFHNANPLDTYEHLDTLLDFQNDQLYNNIYPTPPSAEIASPKNEYTFQTPPYSDNMSPLSNFATNSDYSLSPISDLERCQEIPPYDENVSEHEETTDKKPLERKGSLSLSMKNYKDLQKDISASFSKKECCQTSRKGCKEIFKEYLKKLKVEERRYICMKITSLDMEMACGYVYFSFKTVLLTGSNMGTKTSLLLYA